MDGCADAFDTKAGVVASELARRGIGPHQRVRVIVDPAAPFLEACRQSRALAEAAGMTDEDVDRLIKDKRRAVNEALRGEVGRSSE